VLVNAIFYTCLAMKTYIVDSFTHEMFKGNPAGVCYLEHELDDQLMLSIAQELNLSETAFIRAKKQAGEYYIRYFSPKMEIPLCGHATLAAAKILFETVPQSVINFTTLQEVQLSISKKGEKLEMEFPLYTTSPATVPSALLQALGLTSLNNVAYNAETNILLLEIDDADLLAKLTPDFEALYKSHDSINGVLITAASEDGVFDFHSRYFWPWSGTNEDPVTGGTHTFLAKYWADILGKKVLQSFQSSKRTGSMEVEILSEDKLLIRGEAVCVLAGELKL